MMRHSSEEGTEGEYCHPSSDRGSGIMGNGEREMTGL